MKSIEGEGRAARHRLEVGARVAKLRQREGYEWTQAELAEKAGITQPSLWSIENGKTIAVTAVVFISLCRALNTTWEYLWDGRGQHKDDEESELVAIFRTLSAAGRMAVLQSARAVRDATPPTPPPDYTAPVKLTKRTKRRAA